MQMSDPYASAYRESSNLGARMLQGCCVLRCLGPEGANDGEQEQDTAMLPHI